MHDHRAQGYESIALKNYNKAIEKAKELGLEKTDRFYHINRQLIILEARIGRSHNSIDRYKKMLLEDPQNLNIYEMLVLAYKQAYQADDAIATAEAGLKIDPNSADMYQMLGEVYMMIGKYEDAIENTEKALKLKPNKNMWRTRAMSYRHLGKTAEYVSAWEDLANWYESKGKVDWANKYRQQPYYLRAKEQMEAEKDK